MFNPEVAVRRDRVTGAGLSLGPVAFGSTESAAGGVSDPLFAACGMVGMRFCPRIRSLHRQRIYCADQGRDHGVLAPVLKRGRRAVNFRLIAEQWDRIDQFYAAFPAGTPRHRPPCRASTASRPSNRFYAANRELGRALKTELVLQCRGCCGGGRAR